jgi:hypothetical protein
MPRYFFHLHNDIEAADPEGRELPGPAEARAAAVVEARAVMMENVQKGRIKLSHRIDVLDETGSLVESVTFADALTVEA